MAGDGRFVIARFLLRVPLLSNGRILWGVVLVSMRGLADKVEGAIARMCIMANWVFLVKHRVYAGALLELTGYFTCPSSPAGAV